MNENQQIDRNLFGVPFYRVSVPGLDGRREQLIERILQLREEEEGITRSNSGGWHSSYELHESEISEVQWLVKQVTQIGCNCIAHADKVKKERIKLQNFWANINAAGDWNAPHAHFPSRWSGVCYLQINEQEEDNKRSDTDGNIFFLNPLPLGMQHSRKVSINVRPENGMLLMFPAYLVHMVAPHFDDSPRISIAFNFRLSKPKAKETK